MTESHTDRATRRVRECRCESLEQAYYAGYDDGVKDATEAVKKEIRNQLRKRGL